MKAVRCHIDTILNHHGISRGDFEEAAGLHQSYVSRVCLGRVAPTMITAFHLAKVLGDLTGQALSVADLWEPAKEQTPVGPHGGYRWGQRRAA